MYKTIYKYGEAEGQGYDFSVMLPEDAGIVAVGKDSRSDAPAFWVMQAAPQDYLISRTFRWQPTGEQFPSSEYRYHGTAHCGEFVWHLLERT